MNKLIYLCNAIDESTCLERAITSDSPAATQKVIQICIGLRTAGIKVIILSLGRGRQKGTGKWYKTKVVRWHGVPIIFAPFFDFPVLTHIVSLFSILPLAFRLISYKNCSSLLAYNRYPHYLIAILLFRICGQKCYLDLEDGNSNPGMTTLQKIRIRFYSIGFDFLCNAGALIASSELKGNYRGTKTLVVHGMISQLQLKSKNWKEIPIKILLGGTLWESTGANLLCRTIEILRNSEQKNKSSIEFLITGRGDINKNLKELADIATSPRVQYLGDLSRNDYLNVLGYTHVGLSLKLPSQYLTTNTFPSKVIEYASLGILILTTKISDVFNLFGSNGALYLNNEQPEELAKLIMWISSNLDEAEKIAVHGQERVVENCNSLKVGERIRDFLF